MDVGPAELLIVLAVVLLLFGSKKLPDLARGMGQAAHEFRKGLSSADDEPRDKIEPPPTSVQVDGVDASKDTS